MFYLKIVKYWFIFLTSIIIITPLTIGILPFISGLIVMWLIYLFLFLGTKTIKTQRKVDKNSTPIKNNNQALILSILFVIFIIQYVKFYTGNDFQGILLSFIIPQNNYSNYQSFFEENNLAVFSINKLPYILIASIFKLLLIYQSIRIVVFQDKVSVSNYIGIFLFIIGFFYSAIGRGTSFEIFEIAIFSFFLFLLNNHKKNIKIKIPTKYKVLIPILIFAACAYFINNISKRYGFDNVLSSDIQKINCANSNFCLNSSSVIYKVSPIFSLLLLQLSSYFTFGIFYISKLIEFVILDSIHSINSSLIPLDSILRNETSFKDTICKTIIDCGVNWVPDINSLIEVLGIIGTISFIFFLGFAAKYLYNKTLKGSIFATILLFFLTEFIISLPSGSFITTSSTNIICIFLSIIIFTLKKIKFEF